jgi:phosphohistidine phosphatase
MVSLYLLRHAKAAPAAPGMRDFDRPLDARGVREARLIGRALSEKGVSPQVILCSAALRTQETLREIAPFMPFAGSTQLSPALYSADAQGYLQEIKSFAHAASLMVIGHNPSTEELAGALVSAKDRSASDLILQGFPPGALAHFEFDGALAHLRPHSCTLAAFIRPKDL